MSTRQVLWVLSTPKMRLRRGSTKNAFLMYLEPNERVWWLQMLFSPAVVEVTAPAISLSWI